MRNTGYKQARIAKKISWPSNLPLNKDGKIIEKIEKPLNPTETELQKYNESKKQAILLLRGEENPDTEKYEVLDYFDVGQKVGYYKDGKISGNTDTRIPSTECIEHDFRSDKTTLLYDVSYNGSGFDIEDSIKIYSAINNRYLNYTITSKPNWIKLTQGKTQGVINTLNLTVDRNRTEDNTQSGDIVLLQAKTNKTITIKVTQKGRLTEGIPTEYPYVTKEKVVDREDLNVVQVGEQIWTQDNYYSKDVIASLPSQEQIDYWCTQNNISYKINIEDYNSVFKSGYTKVKKNELLERIQIYYNDTEYDDKKYQISTYDDFFEFIGYIVAREGATSDQQFYKTTGKTLSKKVLDTTINGYDDVRVSYPLDWRVNIGTGSGLTDYLLKTGTDDYALGYMTLGSIHLRQDLLDDSILPFNHSALMMQEDSGTWGSDYVSIMTYSLNSNPNNIGWAKTINDQTAYHPKPLRLVRYRKLPYEVYHNSSTDTFLKIKTNDPIPEGYTIEPKGLRRGIYLGNPDLTGGQIGTLMYWVYNSAKGLSNYNNKIG